MKDDLVELCKLLELYEVQYMLVGGTAVALHGFYRHSITINGKLTEKPDIDIWYNPSYENYFNILKVIKHLGYDITHYENESQPDPKTSFFQLEFETFTLDLLPSIKIDLKFSDASKRKQRNLIQNTPIYFIGLVDLIADKVANGREKDLRDIEELKKTI